MNGDEYKKWKAGDTTIPLADVVDSFQVFHTGQGTQGIMGHPSKQQLDTCFGTHTDTDVVEIILKEGELQAASEYQPSASVSGANRLILSTTSLFCTSSAAKDGYSTSNDSNSKSNVVSAGARAGGR